MIGGWDDTIFGNLPIVQAKAGRAPPRWRL